MAAKESQGPFSRAVPPQRADEHGGRSPGAPAAGVRLRGDVPAIQAARQWQRTFDALPDLIAILDTQHRLVWVNKAMADRLGVPKDPCIGQPCYRLVHGAEEPPPFCPHARLLQDGGEHTVECHVERLTRDYLVTASPLRDSTGRLVGGVHVARDVTERKQAEKALRDSEARYRSLVETAREGIGIVDPDENIVFVNEAYAEMLGYRKEELLGRNLRDLCEDDEFAKYRRETRKRRKGKSSRYETVLRHKSGGLRSFSVSASPLFDDQGAFSGTLGLVTDISDQKRAEKNLRDSEQRFRALAELLPQTIYESDLEDRLTYVNRRALEVFGYTQEDFEAGVSCIEMLAPHERHRARRNIQRILDGQGSEGNEYTAQRKDGTQFPAIIYSSAILREGKSVGLRGIIVDVTKRKRTEQALRRSERRFRETLENVALIAVQTDSVGRLTFCNKFLARLTGWSPRELIGREWIETLVPPDWRDRMRRDFLEAAKAGGEVPEHYKNPILTRSGAERLLSWSNTVMRDEDGRVVGLTAIGQDITERKRAEERLQESEQKYRALVEGSLQGIVVVQDLRIVFANGAAAEIAGLTLGQALALSAEDLRAFIPPEDRAGVLRRLEDRLAGRPVPPRREYRLLRRDGTVFWIEAFVRLIQYLGKPAIHVSFVDITERKRAEQALRKSERKTAAAERLAATGRMAARVAHEINNPLAGIKNSFRLVKEAVPKDHPDYPFVGRIEKEIDRIARIVRQMYRLHSPRQKPVSKTSVEETIRDVVLMLEPACREHEVRIQVEVSPPQLTVTLPEGSLQPILYNLLANAIEASPAGSAVKIQAVKTDRVINLQVSDQGPGIPQELRDRVFEPLFTTKSDTAKAGLGLGLSVVRGEVEKLQGSVRCEGGPAGGAVFRVTLPVLHS